MCTKCKAILKMVSFGFKASEIEKLMEGQELEAATDAGYESYRIMSIENDTLIFRQNYCGYDNGSVWTYEDFEYQL